MKIALFQELLDLNRAFEEALRGLERMEKVHYLRSDLVRRAHADVETIRVSANRELFDNFDAMVEDHASWAYRFQREHNDPADTYFALQRGAG